MLALSPSIFYLKRVDICTLIMHSFLFSNQSVHVSILYLTCSCWVHLDVGVAV